eukprot:11564293-Alexandrium_andersonii.AAC.1
MEGDRSAVSLGLDCGLLPLSVGARPDFSHEPTRSPEDSTHGVQGTGRRGCRGGSKGCASLRCTSHPCQVRHQSSEPA